MVQAGALRVRVWRSRDEVNDNNKCRQYANDNGKHEKGHVSTVTLVHVDVPLQEVHKAEQQVHQLPVRTERTGERAELLAGNGSVRAHKVEQLFGGGGADKFEDGAGVDEEEGGEGHDVEAQAQCAVVDSIHSCDEGIGSEIASELLVSGGKTHALRNEGKCEQIGDAVNAERIGTHVDACGRVELKKERLGGGADNMIELEVGELEHCAVVLGGVRSDDGAQAGNEQRETERHDERRRATTKGSWEHGNDHDQSGRPSGREAGGGARGGWKRTQNRWYRWPAGPRGARARYHCVTPRCSR